MVLLQLTDRLRDRLDALSPRLPAEIRSLVAAHLAPAADRQQGPPDAHRDQIDRHNSGAGTTREATISHHVLGEVANWAQAQDNLRDRDQYRLASLLRLTDVYAPPLPERVKSPELLAILADLQLRQDRIAYSSMTSLSAPTLHRGGNAVVIPLDDPHDPAHSGRPPKSVAEEWDEIRRELGAVVNVGASMLAVGTAVWWVGGGRSYAARLCLALAGAVAIAAIEGFLYYRFFTAMAAKKAREAAFPPTLKTPKSRTGTNAAVKARPQPGGAQSRTKVIAEKSRDTAAVAS
ncbi:hypothetical protein JCM3774_006827 [Rhodotorula dairenensis]